MAKISGKGLGRGLSALMQSAHREYHKDSDDARGHMDEKILEIHWKKISPNKYQPRRIFDQIALDELAVSIRENGIISPIIVRRFPVIEDGKEFELIAGERRFRAALIVGFETLPARVIDADDSTSCEIAILENTQRENLSAIEEAEGYKRLVSDFQYTQEMIAKKTGKSRSHVANIMRLLHLPEEIQEMIVAGKLTFGHGRALLIAKDPSALAKIAIDKKLSVRQVEDMVQKQSNDARGGERKISVHAHERNVSSRGDVSYHEDPEVGIEFERIANVLSNKVGLQVVVRSASDDGESHVGKEKISVMFHCDDFAQLDRLMRFIINVEINDRF